MEPTVQKLQDLVPQMKSSAKPQVPLLYEIVPATVEMKTRGRNDRLNMGETYALVKGSTHKASKRYALVRKSY